ncbi:MAG: DUF616 domain-containing protein [Bacteroidales bacterium]|nr:DUF616 domain-containing protein [Bacteroidales bacterium]
MEKVIYTVLTGGYDRLEQPLVTDPSYHYICFGDTAGTSGVWELREIPFEGTPVMRARWTKMHPHLLLPEYDYSVFMDANLCISGAEFYGFIGQDSVAVLQHPERDCVWDELRYCYLKDKISTRSAFKVRGLLRDMPRHWGLVETNILARRHNDPAVIALDELWWKLLVESGGSRDQLVFTPALHKLGMEPSLLFGPGLNARNVPFVKYTLHPLTGRENTPGKLNWANLKYNLRLLWRKAVLPCLK